jgi:LEA14-like dessication related protein
MSLRTVDIIFGKSIFVVLLVALVLAGCKNPDEDIVLRNIRDVVVDATSDPMLKANAIFYNPNKIKGRLKKIDIEIFVDGKKAASVEQSLKTAIPAAAEFTVPIEVKLALKEFGFMDTLLGMVGGKSFKIHYKGSLRLSYHGLPIKVPVDYHDEVKLRF